MPQDFWKYVIMLAVVIVLFLVTRLLRNNQAFKDFVKNIRANKQDTDKLRDDLNKTDNSDPSKFPEYKE